MHTRLRRLRLLAHEDEEIAYYARQRFADEDLEDELDDDGKEVMEAVRAAKLKRAREELKRPGKQSASFKGNRGGRRGRGWK